MRTVEPKSCPKLAIRATSGAILLGAFIIDMWTPLGFAAGALYIVAVLLSAWNPDRRATLLVAATSTALILMSVFLDFDDVRSAWLRIAMDHSSVICGVWITALITSRYWSVMDQYRASKERYQRAVTAARVGLWDWDAGANKFYLTTPLQRMLALGDQLPQTLEAWMERIHPDDRKPAVQAFRDHLSGRSEAFQVEYRMTGGDGVTRWYLCRGATKLDGAGAPEQIVGAVTDITERKRYEALREGQNRVLQELAMGKGLPEVLDRLVRTVEELIDGMVGAVLLMDDRGMRLWYAAAPRVPDAFRRAMDGFPVGNKTGPCALAASEQRRVVIPDLRNTTVCDSIRDAVSAAGLRAYWSQPIFSPSGTLLGTFAMYGEQPRRASRDDLELLESAASLAGVAIEHKRAEQELQGYARALESANRSLEEFSRAAQEANRAKSEFLANMSHEIRTPMTAILGYADLLRDRQQNEEENSWIDTIRRNGNYLLEIINDILDLSKIEANQLQVESIRCSPKEIIQEVRKLMQVRAGAKGLPLNLEFDGLLPETIQSDPTRIRQILINLVGNAIKFTDSGSVRIRCRCLAQRDLPALEIEVIDSGIGMTAEQMARLFDPFTQADSSTTRRYGGTGLGLTISKRLTEILGGEIAVESEYGRGSRFRVTIATGPLDGVLMIKPNEMKSAPGAPKPAKERIRLDCHILLAEDGVDNQRLISLLLTRAGARVTVVENGRLALEKALGAVEGESSGGSNSRPFDIILMDMQMPEMDGYDATRRLRERGYQGPIIALTAHTMADDRQKCLDVGCDDFAPKPIHRKRLMQMIARWQPRRQGAAPLDESGAQGRDTVAVDR
jgi:PAS domain S-box-containing protein